MEGEYFMFSAWAAALPLGATSLFIPHGHCYLWKQNLVGLHITSDAAIALAYYSIPTTLVYFVRKRSQLPFVGIFLLFGAFILSCGTTHIMEIWTLWHPDYWAAGILKAFTAIISVLTAVALLSIIPKALDLPSPQQLEDANQRLQQTNQKLETEIAERQRSENNLIESRAQFMGAFEAAAIGMALVSLEGEWLQVNSSLCQMLGYSDEELQTKTFQEITHPEDLALDLDYIRQMLAGEIQSYRMEKRYFHKQGHLIMVLLAVSLVRNSEGEALYFVSQIEDITSQKLAETMMLDVQEGLEEQVQARTAALQAVNEALKASEARYSDLYEHAPDMYVSVNAETAQVVQCNQTLLSALGYDREAVIGQPIFNLYHPDCLPAVHEAFDIFVRTGEVHDAELQLQRQDGSPLDVSLNVQAKRDRQGNIVSSRSSWRDITERKRLKRQLQDANARLEERVAQRTQELSAANAVLEAEVRDRKQAEQRLQLALEASKEGLWDWDIPQDRVYFDTRFQTMLGYEDGELSGGTEIWKSLIHPDDRSRAIESLEAHLQDSDVPYSYDYRLRKKSGGWLWIANYGKVVQRDQQGQPLRMIGTHQDISDRKQSELVLREKEAFLSSIYEGTQQAIFVIDVTGEDEFRFAGFNPALEQLTGLDSEASTGATPEEALPPTVAQLVRQRYQDCVSVHNTISYEECLTFRGQPSWWLTNLTPLLDADSQVYRIIGASSNVTLLKETEQRLRTANEDLAHSNKELENFAYIASHDLQEPLRKVRNFSELLASQLEGELDETAQKYINYVTNGAERMQTMIRDLLSYSRVGRTDLNRESTNLNHIMTQVKADLETAIIESQATISVESLPTIEANQTQMRQLLQNLVSNGLKYRGEAPPEIVIRAEQQENNWIISVQDNGIGIEPQYQEQIFTIFQRLHTREQYPGTGIGLSTCKKIVELYGGKIWLESALNQGCTFFFSLPIHQQVENNKV